MGTNGACLPDLFCLALHRLRRDWVWEGMPVDTAAPFVAQMADADPPLAETMATLQRKIASLEKTIEDMDDEMKREGVKLLQRLAALKSDKDKLVKLQDQLVELERQKRITMELQLRTQQGTPRSRCALPTTRYLVRIVEIMHHLFSLTLILQLVTLAPYGHSFFVTSSHYLFHTF